MISDISHEIMKWGNIMMLERELSFEHEYDSVEHKAKSKAI